MSESNKPDSASTPNASRITSNSKTSCSWLFTSFMTVLVPVVAASILYNLDSFDPAPLPPDLLTRHAIAAPASNKHMLRGAELVGVGNLEGPEDVAYDHSSGVIYTGCADGWINRVNVNDSEVQKWINTGGRPLGIAVGGLKQEVVVADAKREYTLPWYLTFKYHLIRKFAAIALKYTGRPYFLGRSGGVLVVDLAGKPIAHYYDPELPLLTSAMKIGDHLYCGSIVAPYIISLNLKQYPAV